MRVLYLFADIIYVIVTYVTAYRKKVTQNNLRRVLPEMDPQQIDRLTRMIYRNLCDLVVESVKSFSISKRELLRRVRFINPEFVDKYYDEKRSVMVIASHYGNWEWAGMAAPFVGKHKAVGVYLPIDNKYINREIKKSRSRFGTELVSARDVPRFFASTQALFACYYLSDYSPSNSEGAHLLQFLNQHTAVIQGPERYARLYDLPVLYGHIRKAKRGYYEVEFTHITEHPNNFKEGELTKKFTKVLEGYILRKPEYWLWTHRRWKLSK